MLPTRSQVCESILADLLDAVAAEQEPQVPSSANYEFLCIVPVDDPDPQSKYHQIKVHQQFIDNLCGYHATYNLLHFLRLFHERKNDLTYLYNPAWFWRYVFQMHRFLKNYRDTHNIEHVLPWKDRDIEHGDYERPYIKPCVDQHPFFKSNLMSSDGLKVTFNVLYFQYGRIINSQSEKADIHANILHYLRYDKPERPLIQAFLLGITCHWITFLAVKDQGYSNFYLMDSDNTEYYSWSKKQIEDYLESESCKKVKQGLRPYTKYEFEMYTQGILDAQDVCSLLVRCLLGKVDFEEYCNDGMTLSYVGPLYSQYINESREKFLSMNMGRFKPDRKALSNWISDYNHGMLQVLKVQQKFPPLSRALITKTYQVISKFYEQEMEGGHPQNPELIRTYNILKATVENLENIDNNYQKPKQTLVYFTNPIVCDLVTKIIDIKKVYFYEFKTKLYHFGIRIQFLENIFHAQTGGQPDDEGYIEYNNREYRIANMLNDRQNLEVYVDVLYDDALFKELLGAWKEQKPVRTFINPEIRLLHQRLHSAGHLIITVLRRASVNFDVKRAHHFPQECFIEFRSPVPVDAVVLKVELQEKIDFALNMESEDTRVLFLDHQEGLKRFVQIPEFVLDQDNIRAIQLFADDPGYPCYGTHVGNLRQIGKVQVDEIRPVGNNQFRVVYLVK